MTTVGRFLMKKIAFLMNFIDKTRNEKHLWLINISARSLMLFFFQFTIWYLKLRTPHHQGLISGTETFKFSFGH